MSVRDFLNKAIAIVRANLSAPPVTQHDVMLRAMALKAAGRERAKRPPRGLYVASVTKIGEAEHRLPPKKGVRRKQVVPIFYQLMANASRYPVAHTYGPRRLAEFAARQT